MKSHDPASGRTMCMFSLISIHWSRKTWEIFYKVQEASRIYLASYEPGGDLITGNGTYTRQEYLLNFGLIEEGIWTGDLGGGSGKPVQEPRLRGAEGAWRFNINTFKGGSSGLRCAADRAL